MQHGKASTRFRLEVGEVRELSALAKLGQLFWAVCSCLWLSRDKRPRAVKHAASTQGRAYDPVLSSAVANAWLRHPDWLSNSSGVHPARRSPGSFPKQHRGYEGLNPKW